MQCNTFSWPAGAQFGTSNTPRGIFIGPNYAVELTGDLNPPSTTSPTALLKNYFPNPGGLTVTDVWNDPTNAVFTYDSFDALVNGNGTTIDPLTTFNVTATASLSTLAINPNDDCSHDGFPIYGLQARPAYVRLATAKPSAANSLEPLAPNPAADFTIIHYSLTTLDAAQPGKLVVRSLISGAVVREMALPSHGAEATLYTQDLPSGVYAVSLFVNGRSLATRRLLVNR